MSRPAGMVAAMWAVVSATMACGVDVLSDAGDADIAALRVSPSLIRIDRANPRQQVLVTLESRQGERIDVTRRADLVIADTAVATLAGSVVTAHGDGKTVLRATFAGVTVEAPLVAVDSRVSAPVHFANDVVPLFSKLGCNSGGCHGKQSGQNGFRLSVFGFDPRSDYDALVKEARGRRVFPADAEKSLLVAKATGLIPHGGGRRAEPLGDDSRLLIEWIRQGMPWGEESAPHLTGLQVEPASRVLGMGADQQILATAIYSDGSRRDVTAAAAYTANADAVAKVDASGLVASGKTPGEAAITVNYMGQVGSVQVFVPRPLAGPFPAQPANNPIDELVWSKLEKLGLVPSALCDDATFLRRLCLDTIGTLPTPDEVRGFLADPDPDKRQQAIDRMLERDELADYWAQKWADILLLDRGKIGERGAYEFHSWLRRQLAHDRPYDEWVRELITASGSTGTNGPANFYRVLRTPEDAARAVSQALLGVRIDCAQCHHHPFDRWAQEDFYGLAGFFNGIQRRPLESDREFVYHAGHQAMTLPLTGQLVPTRPLAGQLPQNLDGLDPRIALAEWITDPGNPWFARLAANRLWKHFLGRGLIEPEDDLRSTNPATNEPLLGFLTQHVIERRYDLKELMRLILNSRVYQLTSLPNDTNADDEQNFSHHRVRRLPAEVLLDAISQVTGAPESFAGMPPGTRSIQLWDNRLPSYFLDAFGRSERLTPCECGKSSEPTMAQALHLMNAPEIEEKIGRESGRVAMLVRSGAAQEQIVEELCLAALGRPADDNERRVAARLFAEQPRRQAAEDFLWTLLNSYDFLFVH